MDHVQKNSDKLPKFHCMPVAHSNSSILEAWVLPTRNRHLDFGGNLRNTCLLETICLYSRGQADKVITGNMVGPSNYQISFWLRAFAETSN